MKHVFQVRIGPVGFRVGSDWRAPIAELKRLYADYPAPEDGIPDFTVRLFAARPWRRWLRPAVTLGGDFVLPESIAILAHLERKHPEVPIFGTTAEEAARIWEEVCEGDQDGLKAFGAIFVPFLFGRSTDVTDAARANADAARQELRRLDARLAEHAFVCGDRPTAGDCVDYPQVRMITRQRERAPDVFAALGFEPFERAFPNVHAWMARIEALPGFERTIPVHWRE